MIDCPDWTAFHRKGEIAGGHCARHKLKVSFAACAACQKGDPPTTTDADARPPARQPCEFLGRTLRHACCAARRVHACENQAAGREETTLRECAVCDHYEPLESI